MPGMGRRDLTRSIKTQTYLHLKHYHAAHPPKWEKVSVKIKGHLQCQTGNHFIIYRRERERKVTNF